SWRGGRLGPAAEEAVDSLDDVKAIFGLRGRDEAIEVAEDGVGIERNLERRSSAGAPTARLAFEGAQPLADEQFQILDGELDVAFAAGDEQTLGPLQS